MYVNVNATEEDLACTAGVMASALTAARMSASEAGVVLLTGERGTGKETVGRYVHQHSPRAAGPFVPVDCLMMDPGTVSVELFGRSKGTAGTLRDSLGLVRSAHGGTLYLDEVAALDLTTQRQLVRLLRTGTVERVGDGQTFPVDVRLIVATTVDLDTWMARGTLLPELRRAWSANTVAVPPLRDRSVDVPALARHLLRARAQAFGEGTKSLTAPAAAALRSYGWPGNLPELAQSLHAAAARVRGRQIDVHDLPGQFRNAVATGVARQFVN